MSVFRLVSMYNRVMTFLINDFGGNHMNGLKSHIRKTISLLLIAAVMICLVPSRTRAANTIADFINRCYSVAFGREADEGGFNYWNDQLCNGKICGSVLVKNFIFSDEYKSMGTTDKQFVTDCYTMFMGREPDESGYKYWCNELSNGLSREGLFAGFANSAEFYELCAGCGLTAGYYDMNYPLDQINNVNLFVERLYKTCLGRIGDKDGQTYWVNGLLKGDLTGTSCAANYILSNEFKDKGLSNEDFVKALYVAFMGREYDDGGLNFWTGEMQNGASREAIFAGFANSKEFESICASYGIVHVSYKLPEAKKPDPTPTPTPTVTPTQPSSNTNVLNGTSTSYNYIVNVNTKVFHCYGCSAVSQMANKNKAYSNCSKQDLINAGYSPCGKCKP